MFVGSLFLLFLLYLFSQHQSSHSLQYESCCDDNFNNKTKISCPMNFVLKLRSVYFYSGNGCSKNVLCKRRMSKQYLLCNNLRHCTISIKCVQMNNDQCLNKRSEHVIVDYDCLLYEPEPPLIALNRVLTIKERNLTTFLKPARALVSLSASATMGHLLNTTTTIDEYDNEKTWNDYIKKNYLKAKPKNSVVLIDDQLPHNQRTLLSDVIWIVVILIAFAFVLIVFMLVGVLLYKKILLLNKNNRRHHYYNDSTSFPANENTYDNLKANQNGCATDV